MEEDARPSGGSSRVRTVVRLRPTPDREGVVAKADRRLLVLRGGRGESDPHESEFVFDRVLGGSTEQKQLFDEVCGPMLEQWVDGYSGCLLAYGQTGSGKSYSVLGEDGWR